MLRKDDDDRQKKLSLSEDEEQTETGEVEEEPVGRLRLMRFKLRTVDLDLIDSSLAQPEGRDENIRELFSVVDSSGWIAPPILQQKGKNQNFVGRYVALDGHRRIAVAKLRGETRLQCLIGEVVTPLQRTAMFFQANVATRPLIGNERIKGYCQLSTRAQKDVVLANLRKGQAKQIRLLEQIFGERRLSEISGHGKALASVPNCVRYVLSWCTSYGLERPTERVIGEWVIAHKMSRTIDAAARKITGRTAQSIVSCIHGNRRFERTM